MGPFTLQFTEQRIKPVVQAGESRVVQLSLPKGERLNKHRTNHILVLAVIQGRVRFELGDQTFAFGPADGIVVEPRQEHAVEALEDSVLLLNLVPAPDTAQVSRGPLNREKVVCAYTDPQLLERMDPALRLLAEDHVDLCARLDAWEASPGETTCEALLGAVKDELSRHFMYEEEILFPRLAYRLGGADVGPVPKLLKEHREIRDVHQVCSELFETWKHPAPVEDRTGVESSLRERMRQLADLLWKHIEKEDNHLFTMAGRILSQEEKDTIAGEIRAREAAGSRR
ncbi:MAG: hemerythrin domain-containing protein [Alicyclobacillus sp.]|nr:hemerythrin domain-containing protein [Alicyclobacillus sp.]